MSLQFVREDANDAIEVFVEGEQGSNIQIHQILFSCGYNTNDAAYLQIFQAGLGEPPVELYSGWIPPKSYNLTLKLPLSLEVWNSARVKVTTEGGKMNDARLAVFYNVS